MVAMKIFALQPGVTIDSLGYLPGLLSEHDARDAKTQFHDHYGYGGGWQKMENFTALGYRLHYPGDPILEPLAMIQFRDERIFLYPASIVAVFQLDDSFEVARMD
jgi:hypothetical protein